MKLKQLVTTSSLVIGLGFAVVACEKEGEKSEAPPAAAAAAPAAPESTPPPPPPPAEAPASK